MARALRWTLPFQSLNGTDCRVDIYDEDWAGDVTTLTGAEDPFEYDEDDDQDLLEDVIRIRSGYIRVVEENYGDLNDIYPLTNNEHYVEFYYNNVLDFVGYIQAQEFESEWGPGPHVIELPVMSPLGYASSITFDYANFNPPRWMTIHDVIKACFDIIGVTYNGYYFPRILDENIPAMPKTLYVNSLTICPFSKDFKKTFTTDGIYKAKTVEDALTMICTGFGLILHDTPGTLIFQRVDHQGAYIYYGFDGSQSTAYIPSVIDIASVASIANTENYKSAVLPLSKIEVTFDGSENIPDMSFERCAGYEKTCLVDGKYYCVNRPVIADFSNTFDVDNVALQTNGYCDYDKVIAGAYGSESLDEMVIFRPADNYAWGSRKLLFTYTFFEWNGSGFRRFSFSFKCGEGMEGLNPPPYGQKIGVLIRTADKYWNLVWRDYTGSELSQVFDFGLETNIINFNGYPFSAPKPLIVEFYAVDDYPNYMFTISNVKIYPYPNPSDEYLFIDKEPNSYVINGGNSQSFESASIMSGCNIQSPTLNRIRYDHNSLTGAQNNKLHAFTPQYPYMFQTQERLQLNINMPHQTPEYIFLNRFLLCGSTGKWKTIAHSFRPWNDTHVMTFHHSTVFD